MAGFVELGMSTNETFHETLFNLTLADFQANGRFWGDIIGEFDGPGTHLFIVASDHTEQKPETVVEIDRHTHCVFFSRTEMNNISRYIEIALQDSPIESEVNMRTIGVISQLAIGAYLKYTVQQS